MSFAETVKHYFALGLGATAGYIVFMMCISLFALFFAGGGFVILRKYNKRDAGGKATPLLKEMTGMQYLGLVMMCIGLAPFLMYFFQGLLFGAGAEAGSGAMESFMSE